MCSTFPTRALRVTLHKLAADDGLRAVVLTDAGRGFSAGFDLASTDGMETGAFLRTVINPVIMALRTMPKPVIAAVNGPAAGVGCSFALAADFVLAGESAYFLLAFARIGLTLDGGASALLSARIGSGRALRLSLLAERIPAAEALTIGLADRLVADADLPAAASAMAAELGAGSTRSYAATKQLINATSLPGLAAALAAEAAAQAQLVRTADHHEAIAAFKAKRSHWFTGR